MVGYLWPERNIAVDDMYMYDLHAHIQNYNVYMR